MKLFLIAMITMLALSACSGRYLGVDRVDLEQSAQHLYDRAQAGDKQAQYDLGMRFASGDGVSQDCRIARKLLREAARTTGGTLWVYSPPVAKGQSGRVIPIDRGPVAPGLKPAKDALGQLDLREQCDP